jgi:hypothetical protein
MCECKRLWDLEPPEKGRLTTIQAALVLNITYNLNANDFIAIRYLEQACEMAKAIGLFGPARHTVSDKSYRARAITAWAVCKWLYFSPSNVFTLQTRLNVVFKGRDKPWSALPTLSRSRSRRLPRCTYQILPSTLSFTPTYECSIRSRKS